MFDAKDAPQPPMVLTTPLEIASNLRMLQESHDPLIITFNDRTERYQSYMVDVDRDNQHMTLDEMIPRTGERYLEAGLPYRVEGFHDGVRIAWESSSLLTIDEAGPHRCYHSALPTEVIYHQRRNAFRAALKLSHLVDVEVAGEKLATLIKGKLLDVSATGCKLRFEGDISDQIQLGQVYERFCAALPFGHMITAVELRHLHFEERLNITFAGMRFHNISGAVQRQVERFVYQLQREARRFDKDDDYF